MIVKPEMVNPEMVTPEIANRFDRKESLEADLVRSGYHRVVSEEVVAGTEIPGGGGRGRLHLSLHCHHQNGPRSQEVEEEGDYTYRYTVTTRMDRDPRRWRKRATTPIATLSPPEWTEIPGGGGRGRLHLSLHCHHQNGPRSQEVDEEGDYTYRYTVTTRMDRDPRRWRKRETTPIATLSPPEGLLH